MSPQPRVEFEDIEALRREAGIDDAELREVVGTLQVGQFVSLTARVGAQAFPGDRLLVRITCRRGSLFRGELARRPTSCRSPLKAGSRVTFGARHIHSVVAEQPAAQASNSAPPMPGRPEGEGAFLAMTTKGPPPPLTTEQRLQEVEEIVKRVSAYAEFMCGPAGLAATSHEARAQAVTRFHERLASLERQLARIHDDFRLG
jgi:hypothetical protein